MKSTISLLDSAVFQLTPTRTSRCDLYIIANGKKEKIASGLLNPFIAAHLKTAQDQIAEGGYSVLLAPQAGSNATWFTLQSFVSTPEILERVYTIESEILQIKDQYIKPASSNEGNKPAGDVNEEEKAIVLYTVTNHQPDAPELPSPSTKERNSKAQLINVLETRKTVLKKEQGMAFARAVAAGFEIENVANLLSFAECFGASRLMSGCLRFMNLWKQKHESGQWVEIEAEDAMSDCTASAIVHSETAGTNTNAAGGEQQYHSWRTASRFPAMGYAFFTAR
ncbi:COP1-interacting protein 7 isoform X6 [Helianthus annuus]|uniref:COP1-interacting protein 7 isoform X6 n=1 Tax=Helianthus annuus TaxID=4232 RepID=UPI000B8F308A|nr:COP1-interacting protein 7 isoform X6 [Helianthus annuus]